MATTTTIIWGIAGKPQDRKLQHIARIAQQQLAGYRPTIFVRRRISACLTYINWEAKKTTGPTLVVIVTDGLLSSTEKTAIWSALGHLPSQAMVLFVIAEATVCAALEFFDKLENDHPNAPQIGAIVHHQDTGYSTARHIIGELLDAYHQRHP